MPDDSDRPATARKRTHSMSDEGYWRFCEIIEQTHVTGPIIAAPAETERIVLEQHTITGAYRVRPLREVAEEAG